MLYKQQKGGTILGLMVGLVIGLFLALGVATYVAKVPIPFLNKGQVRSADQDVVEAEKNKNWDPNAPLYGKNPVKPPVNNSDDATDNGAEKNSSKDKKTPDSVEAKSNATDKADKNKKDQEKTTVAAALPKYSNDSADPLGDLARAKVSPVVVSGNTATPQSDELSAYYVQAGAFNSANDAEVQKAKLAMMGWQAKVIEREQAGRTIFRVRMGPFGKRDEAETTKEKLSQSGFDSSLIRLSN